MVGSDTVMWAFHRLQPGFAAGAIIVGLTIWPTFSVRAASSPISAAIAVVASVENPVGAASLDELRLSTAISDPQAIDNLSSGCDNPQSAGDRILLYSPSPEICIVIASDDDTPVEFQILPLRWESGSSANAGGEGPQMELLNLTREQLPSPPPRLTITLIPAGY
jgi:hypothetical protein